MANNITICWINYNFKFSRLEKCVIFNQWVSLSFYLVLFFLMCVQHCQDECEFFFRLYFSVFFPLVAQVLASLSSHYNMCVYLFNLYFLHHIIITFNMYYIIYTTLADKTDSLKSHELLLSILLLLFQFSIIFFFRIIFHALRYGLQYVWFIRIWYGLI